MEFDLAYLRASNPIPLTEQEADGDEQALINAAVADVKALCEEVIKLPTETTEEGMAAKLPAPRFPLPREKPLPQARLATKWEQFAAAKGIVHKRKSRLVYDEKTGEYRPRFGRNRRTDNTTEFDGIVPAKPGVDDFQGAEDPFTRARRERRERVRKNKENQERNQRRAERAARQGPAKGSSGKGGSGSRSGSGRAASHRRK